MQTATVDLPFAPGDVVWHKGENKEVTLINAFASGGRVVWTAQAGDNKFTVHESDIGPIPKLEEPLKEGERIKINLVPWTVIRDAFPSLPGGKGAIARKIVTERDNNGDFKSLEDLRNRMGLGSVNWEEIGLKLDFGK